MARDGARFLMLGTPNGGSWAPMQVLSGDDTFGNALVAFGALFDNGGARKLMAGMPGFMQLQAALLDPTLGLDKREHLAEARRRRPGARCASSSIWHARRACSARSTNGACRRRPCSTRRWRCARGSTRSATALGVDAQKMLLVVGHAPFTPDGYRRSATTASCTSTRPTAATAACTLASALLPGVRTWKLDAEHGKLPDVAERVRGLPRAAVDRRDARCSNASNRPARSRGRARPRGRAAERGARAQPAVARPRSRRAAVERRRRARRSATTRCRRAARARAGARAARHGAQRRPQVRAPAAAASATTARSR